MLPKAELFKRLRLAGKDVDDNAKVVVASDGGDHGLTIYAVEYKHSTEGWVWYQTLEQVYEPPISGEWLAFASEVKGDFALIECDSTGERKHLEEFISSCYRKGMNSEKLFSAVVKTAEKKNMLRTPQERGYPVQSLFPEFCAAWLEKHAAAQH